jgi:hypothetical protein
LAIVGGPLDNIQAGAAWVFTALPTDNTPPVTKPVFPSADSATELALEGAPCCTRTNELAGSFTIMTGASNQPAHGGIVITGGPNQFNIKLRADKDAIYTLVATATDLAGNISTQQTTCSVPHDQGK